MSESQSKEKQEILETKDSDTIEIENEQVKQVIAEVVRSEFSGPMPPPSILRGYEDILPGSADRILKMAEKQSEHRQAMERKMISAESRDSLLGVLFAFCLGAGCIVAAVIMVITVPENAGAISATVLGTTGIGAIITTFIKNTRRHIDHNKNNKESQE